MADPVLNPALDAAVIAAAYARNGRVHIPGILTDDGEARVERERALEQREAVHRLHLEVGQQQVGLMV